jgi:acetyl-CoA acyltransferase
VELFEAQKKKQPALFEEGLGGIEDVLVGCAYPEGEQGYNVARVASLGVGLAVSGITMNRLCASSLDAMSTAAARIEAGWGQRFLVGGVESMSRVERRGANFSPSDAITTTCPQAYVTMGETAENVAGRYAISRERQEEFAARSHELALKAYEAGHYATQIHPYLIERDEFMRYPVDRAKVASLKPAFAEDGIVTAATSSPLTDGATSGWVVERELAASLGVETGLEIMDMASAHVAPEVMGLGPVPATQMLLKRRGLRPEDIHAFEMNEAFAIQTLACIQELGIPLDRVNTWGGALAVGHPLGASGLRLLMTLHDRLAEVGTPGALGLATLCVGGGQGVSVLARWVEL